MQTPMALLPGWVGCLGLLQQCGPKPMSLPALGVGVRAALKKSKPSPCHNCGPNLYFAVIFVVPVAILGDDIVSLHTAHLHKLCAEMCLK